MAFIVISLIWPISIIYIKSCLTLFGLCVLQKTQLQKLKRFILPSNQFCIHEEAKQMQTKAVADWKTGSLASPAI